jgi:RND family efflux transporter MFP subunit
MKLRSCAWLLWLVVFIVLADRANCAEGPVKQDAKPGEAAKEAKPDAAKDAKPEAPAKPATIKLKKAPLKVEVTLDGTFEAQKTTEIVLRPQEWAGLTVLSAVEHGSAVKRGDLLVSLDFEKIDRAIGDLRTEMQVADIGIKQAEQDLKSLESLTPMDLAAAERSHRYAVEDHKLYKEVIRPTNLRMAEFMLKMSKQRLEYVEEELKQLEKMYKADDLTEETEEIVLRRARNQAEVARFSHELAKQEYDDTMKRDLPRTDARVADVAQRADVTWEKGRVVLPLALQKQRSEVEKLRLGRSRSEERLAKLLADRAAMSVKAPADGVVYYGSCDRGKWTAGIGEEFRRGAAIQANKVFMTLVQPRPMQIRVNVPEKQLCNVRPGLKAAAKPAGYPDLKLTAIVERVGGVPMGAGNFDGRLTVALGDQAAALMPGMTCEVKITAYEKADAIAVPPSALSADETDEQKQFVYVVGKDGKSKRQPVTVGKRTEKQVEVLSGLKEGDEILTEAPKDKK